MRTYECTCTQHVIINRVVIEAEAPVDHSYDKLMRKETGDYAAMMCL